MRDRRRPRYEDYGESRRDPNDRRHRSGREERSRFDEDAREFRPQYAREPSYDPERDRYAASHGREDEHRRTHTAYEPWRFSPGRRDYEMDRSQSGEYRGAGSYGNRDFGWYGGGGHPQDFGSRFEERERHERPGGSGYPSYGFEDDPNYGYERGMDYGDERSYRGARSWQSREQRQRPQGFGRPNFTGRGPRGYKRSDERIREDVCDRLLLDPEVDASDIEVRVADGQVTLEGTIDDRRAKHRAENLCEAIPGVQDVANHLHIKREPSQPQNQLLGSAPCRPMR